MKSRNSMPGCENTTTQNYTNYIQPNWNAGSNAGTFIVTSDPQYPRTRDSSGSENGNNPTESTRRLDTVLSDIAALRRATADYIPLLINGDLTEFGHGEQRVETQRLFHKLSGGRGGPLFFPGLGNHDYQNNVNDCANNGCARDSVCDVIQWAHQAQPKHIDYHYATPEHRGSLSYSVDVGKLHFIQLHNSPVYNVYFETGNNITHYKRKFKVTSSLTWLESDLRDARRRGQIIFLNMHMRNTWPAGDAARFKRLIQDYNVTAAFAGHYHGELGRASGTTENFGAVPVFQSGALLNTSYLIATYNIASMTASIYKVPPGRSHAQKELVSTIPLKAGTTLPVIDFSDSAITLYEGNNATQDVVCDVPINSYHRFNFNGIYGCKNDEARSLRINKARAGTLIQLYGNWDQQTNEAYATVKVKTDILFPVAVGSFDSSRSEAQWQITKYGPNTLDGKISSAAIEDDNNFSQSTVTLHEGNNGSQNIICTKSIATATRFNMGGSSGCSNDEARSATINRAIRGTELCFYGNWDQNINQGYACILVYKNITTPRNVGSFNYDYDASDGAWRIRHYGSSIDGKVSSAKVFIYDWKKAPPPETPR